MTMTRIATIGTLAVGLLLAPATLVAQEEGPPAEQQDTELVFEREIFVYPQFERRNPFRPLAVGEGGIVRYEQLSVMGIMYSDDPALSLATFTTGELTVSADGAGATRGEGQTFYARVGQTIGNVRVVEIHQTQVVVEVDEFGIWERKIMQLQTRRLGGTQ